MQDFALTNPIILLPLVMTVIIILFFIIYASRYRKFSPNEYVIWLRNGCVRKIELGGSGWLYPLIDQVIILPVAMQLTKLELELYDYQQALKTLIINLELNWRIKQPEIFYAKFFSMTENNIKNGELEQLFKSFVRDSLVTKTLDDMYGKTRNMMNDVKDALNERLKDFGIGLESLEIETIINL